MKKAIFIIVLLSLFAETMAVINIPDDYPTIQQGIDVAIPGDTILIAPGTYIEELEIEQKDLTLGSHFLTSGDTTFINNTILDGDSTYHILTCWGPHEIIISGLTFTHGYGDWIHEPYTAWGGAVTANDYTDISFNRCCFNENYGVRNTCINANDSCSVTVRGSGFSRNSGFPKTNVISNNIGRELTVHGCSFFNNTTRFWPLIVASSCRFAFVDSCVFASNHGSYSESTSGMLLYCFAQRIAVTNCSFLNHTFITAGRSLIDLEQADTLVMNNCLIDSTTISFAHEHELIRLNGGNDHVFLNNIRISNNYSTDGDGFGIGIRAQGTESLTADSIFIVNNHEEYRHNEEGLPGCTFGTPGNCTLSNIYVMNNSVLRSDIDEYPDVYGGTAYVIGVGGETVNVNHLVKSDNVNDFVQSGLGLSIGYASPDQTVYLNNIKIHDNTRLYATPNDEWSYGGSGIMTTSQMMRKLEINNLRLYNQYHTVYAAGMHLWADTVIINNSHISDCGNGAITLRTQSFALENVLVHDCWNTRGESSSHIVSTDLTESARISNCTIVDSYGDYGSALSIWSATQDEKNVLIENCIIDNSCSWGSDLDYLEDANIDLTVQYSNIDGGWEGVGNIDTDPLFTDPENDDYTFQEGSPCIDTGNPDPAYNDPEDPNHTGWPLWPSQGTLRNDMGCYGGPGAIELWEYQDVPSAPQPDVRPSRIQLSQNYPNPFNPTTTIEFTLPHPLKVQLTVYNILGQQVQLLSDLAYSAGVHQVRFDGSGLSSGVYVYRLTANDHVMTRKMVLMK